MEQSDPEPAPAADPGNTPAANPKAELNGKAEPDDAAEQAKPAEPSEPEPTPEEKARRMVRTFLWTCGWLTILAAAFLLSDVVQSDKPFGAVGWISVVLTYLCVLALVAAYFACARGRVTLRTRLLGRFDLFQVSTVLILVAVIFGLLIPTSHTATLALLLPWALTYWMYGLDRPKPPAA
ncbi:hypothetical protein JOF29_004840 [Kribbella aluminosa]|uniref:Uncharacterized protein n=1 Tax=Kribbella aluminosa TaxID=416017 RepID=A0ABS4UQ08_9ACTN|nr:hypothetical protein [Kribbella aluminosa]MBP2353730.1 hypothetical protein [Kribbella aluminosa]